MDEGQSGQALIPSSFNYKRGENLRRRIYLKLWTTARSRVFHLAYDGRRHEHQLGPNFTSPVVRCIKKKRGLPRIMISVSRFAGVSYTWEDWNCHRRAL